MQQNPHISQATIEEYDEVRSLKIIFRLSIHFMEKLFADSQNSDQPARNAQADLSLSCPHMSEERFFPCQYLYNHMPWLVMDELRSSSHSRYGLMRKHTGVETVCLR